MIRTVCGALVGLVLVNSIALAQRPSDEESSALVERSRSKANDYARSLPDFVCTEIINRDTSYNPPVQRKPIPTETLTVKLSYFQQKEEHKLLMVDNKPTNLAFENLSGAIGTGEFGSTLKAIFDPKSATSFHWERWKNVRKHRAAVYAYVVDLARSQYLIGNSVLGHLHKAVVGYHGEMEIDTETAQVLGFTYQADKIPRDLELQIVATTVDYDFAEVGGRSYLLPSHSNTILRDRHVTVTNEMEFREYRKFSADSVIDFGTAK
jgi:hypothetical protein